VLRVWAMLWVHVLAVPAVPLPVEASNRSCTALASAVLLLKGG
jgi:hypothetical protein